MIKFLSNYKLFSLIFLIISIAFIGCEKKTEQTEQPKKEMQTEQTAQDTVSEIKEPVVEEKITIPDMKGTWTGKFDNRISTLIITEQDSIIFKGSITINYREVINQQVSGKLNLEAKTFTMNDQLKNRFAGTYSGKISDNLNTLQGTFIQTVDKRKSQFNFNRK